MPDLPIDDTWILIGIALLALAAVSQLQRMWKEARSGLGDDKDSKNHPPADDYFSAWKTATDNANLRLSPTEDPLDAPLARGRLRRLPAEIAMELQRGDRRRLDPEAVNPATVRCRITARIQLPLPWHNATVRRFILPNSVTKSSTDDVIFDFELPEGVRLRGVRLNPEARQTLANMDDEFETVKVVDGVMTAVDYAHPSRNSARWPELFGDRLGELRREAGAFANGGLVLDFELSTRNAEMELNPAVDPTGRRCGVSLAIDELSSADGERVRSQLKEAGLSVDSLDHADGELKIRGTIARSDQMGVPRLIKAVAEF